MEVIIKLNLNKAEEKNDFYNIVNANKMYSLLFEIKHNLGKKARNEFERRKENETLKDYEDELDVFFSLIEDDLKELTNI